jgi:hypothetical protein
MPGGGGCMPARLRWWSELPCSSIPRGLVQARGPMGRVPHSMIHRAMGNRDRGCRRLHHVHDHLCAKYLYSPPPALSTATLLDPCLWPGSGLRSCLAMYLVSALGLGSGTYLESGRSGLWPGLGWWNPPILLSLSRPLQLSVPLPLQPSLPYRGCRSAGRSEWSPHPAGAQM